MHLKNVELFCDIVASRSFSKAAELRRISQPAASLAVQQLEEHLGVELIDRTTRPFELTAAGKLYYERCRELLEDYRAIEDAVQHLGAKVLGRARVASIYSVGLLQMAEYAKKYEEQYPDVDLRLDYLHPDDVYARVRSDEADLGIVSFPRGGDDIGVINWDEQEMVAVVWGSHPLADRVDIQLKDLDGQNFVAFNSELRIRKETDKHLKAARVSVTITHQFDNVENIKRAVEIGAGVAILPRPTILREMDYGMLKGLTLSDVSFTRPLGIIHKRHKHFSTAAEKFVELLTGSTSSATRAASLVAAHAD